MSDSASFWSRCIFFHESTTPRRQTRENQEVQQPVVQTKKQTNKPNTSESAAMCRRHQVLTKRQRNPCVLSVSATSRVRVTCAAIAFPRSVPVCAKAPTTVVAQLHDLLMATSSRLSILSKAWSVHSSEPVHDNEHSCARQLLSAVPRRQLDATRHWEAGRHMYTQRCTQTNRKTQTETQSKRYGKRRAETFQMCRAVSAMYDVDNRFQ